MNIDFDNDFVGSLAYIVFMFASGLTCATTFVYSWIDTGSLFAAVISTVTLGFIGGLFLGVLAAFVSLTAWFLFVLGRSIYFNIQRRAQHKSLHH
mgnify:CR=1 FL=1